MSTLGCTTAAPWSNRGRALCRPFFGARIQSATKPKEVGQLVGYRTRFERCLDPHGRTRIQVVTDGILLRQTQRDPTLPGVAAVLFDEFHERSVGADARQGIRL